MVRVGGEEVVGAGVEFETGHVSYGGTCPDEGPDKTRLDTKIMHLDHCVVRTGGNVGKVSGPVQVVDGKNMVFHDCSFFVLLIVKNKQGAIPIPRSNDGCVGS